VFESGETKVRLEMWHLDGPVLIGLLGGLVGLTLFFLLNYYFNAQLDKRRKLRTQTLNLHINLNSNVKEESSRERLSESKYEREFIDKTLAFILAMKTGGQESTVWRESRVLEFADLVERAVKLDNQRYMPYVCNTLVDNQGLDLLNELQSNQDDRIAKIAQHLFQTIIPIIWSK